MPAAERIGAKTPALPVNEPALVRSAESSPPPIVDSEESSGNSLRKCAVFLPSSLQFNLLPD